MVNTQYPADLDKNMFGKGVRHQLTGDTLEPIDESEDNLQPPARIAATTTASQQQGQQQESQETTAAPAEEQQPPSGGAFMFEAGPLSQSSSAQSNVRDVLPPDPDTTVPGGLGGGPAAAAASPGGADRGTTTTATVPLPGPPPAGSGSSDVTSAAAQEAVPAAPGAGVAPGGGASGGGEHQLPDDIRYLVGKIDKLTAQRRVMSEEYKTMKGEYDSMKGALTQRDFYIAELEQKTKRLAEAEQAAQHARDMANIRAGSSAAASRRGDMVRDPATSVSPAARTERSSRGGPSPGVLSRGTRGAVDQYTSRDEDSPAVSPLVKLKPLHTDTLKEELKRITDGLPTQDTISGRVGTPLTLNVDSKRGDLEQHPFSISKALAEHQTDDHLTKSGEGWGFDGPEGSEVVNFCDLE